MLVRTWFAIISLAILFVVSWTVSLGRLFTVKFWDPKYSIDLAIQAQEDQNGGDPLFYNSTAFSKINLSYFTYRYIFFAPHVVGAIIWWNLYFIQLIPSIRKRFKTFHRYLGRFLMLIALIQVLSGLGLACTSHSSTIKIVSFVLAIAVIYCLYHALRYAMARDIPMHKYWVQRTVGYFQTIALQRFYLMVLILSHQSGFYFFYPPLDDDSTQEQINSVVLKLFDDSFTLSILTAILATEWYLNAEQNMMAEPLRTTTATTSTSSNNIKDGNDDHFFAEKNNKITSTANERLPLNSGAVVGAQ